MNLIFRTVEYLRYLWSARGKYYLHSPFAYRFFLEVLEGPIPSGYDRVNQMRKTICQREESIEVEDLGTGLSSARRIRDFEKNVAISQKYGLLLMRLIAFHQPNIILELGTSVGISSAYMALAKPDAKIITIEGSAALAEMARRTHDRLGIKNVQVVCDEFQSALNRALPQIGTLDLVFFDGNHRKDATILYFEQCLKLAGENSVFVFDDIYWSADMKKAWKEIKKHPRITLTIDVFQFGICFFSKQKLAKEHFVLRH